MRHANGHRKLNRTSSHRQAMLRNMATSLLKNEIIKSRKGGYLRILKCGFRDGDNAPMAFVELVDRPIVEVAAPAPKEEVVAE